MNPNAFSHVYAIGDLSSPAVILCLVGGAVPHLPGPAGTRGDFLGVRFDESLDGLERVDLFRCFVGS